MFNSKSAADGTKTARKRTTDVSVEANDLKYLGGWLMSKMALGGASRLRNNADKVNKLNVFPVPDGDTGDNMRMTIESGIAAIETLESDDLAEVMKVFSHGMLLGARGNSGVILSQFFAGAAKGFEGEEKADPAMVGRALQEGVKQAYKSVVTPTEGTILTVAREAVEYANSRITPQSTIRSFFADLVGEMHESLERTPEALAVLKEAGVVDSGGAGLLYIMEGFNKVLNGEEVPVEESAAAAPAPKKAAPIHFGPDSKMEYGYCTEVLVQLMNSKTDVEAYDIEPLKEFLSGIGNSIVCFKTDSIVKVHVHTMTPELVIARCREVGEFISVKIENMSIQHTELSGGAEEAREHGLPEAEEAPETAAPENGNAPEPRKPNGVVAVANGPGIRALFEELGADVIIEGGQTNNPSTNDFIQAFGRINADNIFVFPNNGNIVMAAQQAGKLWTKANVVVIPSKDCGAGYVALSAADLSGDDPAAIRDEMTGAMENTVSAVISPAVRDADMNGVHVTKGDTIGIIGKKIVLSEADRASASFHLGSKLLEMPEKFMLTIFRGQDATAEEAEVLQQCLQEAFPDAELYLIDGGQDIYPFIFVVE